MQLPIFIVLSIGWATVTTAASSDLILVRRSPTRIRHHSPGTLSHPIDRGKGLEAAPERTNKAIVAPWEQAWGDESEATEAHIPPSQSHHLFTASTSRQEQAASSSAVPTFDLSRAVLTQQGLAATPHPFDTWSALYPAGPHVSSYNPSAMAAALQGLNTNAGLPLLPLASSGQAIRSWKDLLDAVSSSGQTLDKSTSQQLYLQHQYDLYHQRQLRQLHKQQRQHDYINHRTNQDHSAAPDVPLQASRLPPSTQDANVASVAGTSSHVNQPPSSSSSRATPQPHSSTTSTSLQPSSEEVRYYVPKWSKRKLKGGGRKRKQREYQADGSSAYYYAATNQKNPEKEEELLWRNDASAEALYDKAEEIFASHLALKNRFKESQFSFKFGLSIDEKEALGDVGQRMYHALRQHHHYVKYEAQHPDRHKVAKSQDEGGGADKAEEEEIKVLMTSVKYIRSKLNDIRRGAFKGTSFTRSDLEKVAHFLHYVQQCQSLPKKQSLPLFRKAVYLLQVLREVRPYIEEDWLLDSYTRHVFKEVNPMPYFDGVFKIMLSL